MPYQQRPYQSTVDQPVVVQPVRPVVIPVVPAEDQERKEGDDSCQVCMFCCGYLGGFFLFCFTIAFMASSLSNGRTSGRMVQPLKVIGSLGVVCTILGLCALCIVKSDKRKQEGRDYTQPVSEPFTQDQRNEGSPMYVPVQSGPVTAYYDNAPSASYSGQMNNVQQPFQHGVHTATGTSQNFGSNKDNRIKSSQICRQWNEGPCSFGEMCRHRHVCSKCADTGKPGEKHKASSEECPNKGKYVPVQSDPGHQYPNNAPSASYSGQMSNVQQPFQHGVHTATGYVPVQSGPGHQYPDNTPSASFSGQMSNAQQPFQHGVNTATGAAQNFGSNKGNIIKSSQICRQWNEGPCSFGEMCRHLHVCNKCANTGKPGEKHKASSEECPNKEDVPVQSDPGHQYPDNAPSASYSGEMSNVQQPFQHGVHTATGAQQNIVSNKGKRIKSSRICRQWNEGPCSFGEMCQYRHVCIACDDTGKTGEKHKASSEECPNEGRYVPVQSVPGHQNPNNNPSASYSGQMSNVQQPFQHGVHTATGPPGIVVPLISGPKSPDPDNVPSVSYYAQMINAHTFQHVVQPTTGAPQNSGSNKANRTKSSNICRQWNEGPCSFGEMCRYRHVCSTCADTGKPGEKHKASSEECPKEGSSPHSSGAEYDQPPAFAPPSYSSQEGSNAGSSPQSSGADKAPFAEYDQPPAFAPPPYSSQEGSNAGRYVPLQSGPGLPYPDFAPSAPYSAQMSDVQQPFQHGIDSSTGEPQHSWSDRAAFVEYEQPPDFDPPPYAP